MNWDSGRHDHVPPKRPDLPEPVRLEECWRVVTGPHGRLLTCSLYADSWNRVEVRMGYTLPDFLATTVVKDVESGRVLATAWLEDVRERGTTATR